MALNRKLKDEVGNPLSPDPKDQTIGKKFWRGYEKKGCGCKHKHA
jgi:hypothetical protein